MTVRCEVRIPRQVKMSVLRKRNRRSNYSTTTTSSEQNRAEGDPIFIRDFVASTTFHGLGHIIKSRNKLAKSFWVLVILAVCLIVCVQLHKLVFYFMMNPTTTSVTVVYPDDGLKFPEVTVCTLQKLNNTRLLEKFPQISKVLAEFSLSSFFSAYSTSLMDLTYFAVRNLSLAQLQKDLDSALNGIPLLQFLEDTTFHCQDLFLMCWFENGMIFPCCNDGDRFAFRVKRHLLHNGPCFEFEVKSQFQRLPGPVGGIGFAFWYPNDHLFPSVFKSYDEHGVHVFTSPTDAMLEKNPIVLPVGTHARISLQASRTTRLSHDQIGRQICQQRDLKYFHNYSYAGCQVECLIDSLLSRCNCVGISTYEKIPMDKLCPPKEAFQCFDDLAFNFSSMLTQCRLQHCTEACHYWSYKVDLTTGKVFIPKLEKDMLKYWRLPPGNPKTSLIIADIFFSDIEYTDIKQLPAMTIESFVSSIGGAMGLWTGASIVTWIHLFFFCLASIFKKKCCQSKKPVEAPHKPQQKRKKDRPKKMVTRIKLDKEVSVSIETGQQARDYSISKGASSMVLTEDSLGEDSDDYEGVQTQC